MQEITKDNIGTMLHMIWHGNPAAAPPINIWTKSGDGARGYLFLGMNSLQEHIEKGKETPSAVIIIAFNKRMGGGPYLLYWVEDPTRKDLMEMIQKWSANCGLEAQEIRSMGIGNVF